MEEWKIIISEDENTQKWVNINQPRLLIEKSDDAKEKFAIKLLSKDQKTEKLIAKCEKLETAMSWAEKLGTETLLDETQIE